MWAALSALNQRLMGGVKARDRTYHQGMRLPRTSTPITTFVIGLVCGMGLIVLSGSLPSDRFVVFSRALSLVEAEYVDERAPEALIYDAIGGLTQGLDDHSVFLDPESYAALA